ncbi:MAG: hypothetical protein AB8B96_07840 [Lysobacterales bacterium]
MMNKYFPPFILLAICIGLSACATLSGHSVNLTLGVDESAGGGPAYIVSTPGAVYFLEKEGGGLSSIVDSEGIDWLGFHNEKGSGWKGEYRGFPNAIHRQDGNYFHAMNEGTDPSTSVVDIDTGQHVRITFTSGNGQWQGQWDFYSDRCDFLMKEVSPGHHYWIQYEGVPGGQMDPSDFRYSSADNQKHPVEESFIGDLPAPEWMAFGDQNSPRVLYVLHHSDDTHPDDYVSRPYMTVLGFGRRDKNKFLDTPQSFSIGFIESTDYPTIDRTIRQTLNSLAN